MLNFQKFLEFDFELKSLENKEEKVHTMIALGKRDAAGISGKDVVLFKYWKKRKDDDCKINISNYKYSLPIILIPNIIKGLQILNKQLVYETLKN